MLSPPNPNPMKLQSETEDQTITAEGFTLHHCLVEKGRKLSAIRRNQKLIRNNDSFNGVLYLFSGRVKVVKDAGLARETIVWIAQAGALIGLEEILTSQPFPYDAITMTSDVKGLWVSRDQMKAILEETPFISMTIAKILCSRLDILEDRITSTAGKRIEKYFAELLIGLVSSEFLVLKNGLQSGYTIKDIAGLMGTSKAYLYKVISLYVKRGIVVIKSKRIEIKNIDSLKLSAGGDLVI
jgi:CRP-like cAMP-binding protein